MIVEKEGPLGLVLKDRKTIGGDTTVVHDVTLTRSPGGAEKAVKGIWADADSRVREGDEEGEGEDGEAGNMGGLGGTGGVKGKGAAEAVPVNSLDVVRPGDYMTMVGDTQLHGLTLSAVCERIKCASRPLHLVFRRETNGYSGSNSGTGGGGGAAPHPRPLPSNVPWLAARLCVRPPDFWSVYLEWRRRAGHGVGSDPPVLMGETVDMFLLFREVLRRGGYERVNEQKGLWRAVFNSLPNFNVNCTNPVHRLRHIYVQFLRDFEICMAQRGNLPAAIPTFVPMDPGSAGEDTVWYSYGLPRIRVSESRVGYALQQILHTEDLLWLLWHDPRLAAFRETNLLRRQRAKERGQQLQQQHRACKTRGTQSPSPSPSSLSSSSSYSTCSTVPIGVEGEEDGRGVGGAGGAVGGGGVEGTGGMGEVAVTGALREEVVGESVAAAPVIVDMMASDDIVREKAGRTTLKVRGHGVVNMVV